jgi:hypothetical protein
LKEIVENNQLNLNMNFLENVNIVTSLTINNKKFKTSTYYTDYYKGLINNPE